MATVSVENIVKLINQLPALDRAKLVAALTQDQSPKATFPKSKIISTNAPFDDRSLDYEWLAKNQKDYIGQWVALKDGKLLANSTKAKDVFTQARQLGIKDPFVILVEDPNIPFVNI